MPQAAQAEARPEPGGHGRKAGTERAWPAGRPPHLQHAPLLVVFLAKKGAVWVNDVEELGHNLRRSARVGLVGTGWRAGAPHVGRAAACPPPPTSPPTHPPPHRPPRTVHTPLKKWGRLRAQRPWDKCSTLTQVSCANGSYAAPPSAPTTMAPSAAAPPPPAAAAAAACVVEAAGHEHRGAAGGVEHGEIGVCAARVHPKVLVPRELGGVDVDGGHHHVALLPGSERAEGACERARVSFWTAERRAQRAGFARSTAHSAPHPPSDLDQGDVPGVQVPLGGWAGVRGGTRCRLSPAARCRRPHPLPPLRLARPSRAAHPPLSSPW